MDIKEEIKCYGLETTRNYRVVGRVLIAASLVGRNKKVLDIGCRTGEVTRFFSYWNDVTGIDFIPEFIEQAKKLKGNYFVFDVDNNVLPFQDKSFDVVFCGETLEHIHNRNNLMQECHRILKDDGKIIICEGNKFSLRRRLKFLFGNEIHNMRYYVHFFHHKELENLFIENGFRITKWLNQGTGLKGIRLPFAFKGSCDTWVVEAVKK
jgi:ubiquinone/menaquinone biosynthesis C-methylase UbiE